MKHVYFLALLIWIVSCNTDEIDDVPPGSPEYLGSKGLGLSTGDASTDAVPPPEGGGDTTSLPGVITAGEWNDLENWEFWLDLMGNNEYFAFTDTFNTYPLNRYSFIITDDLGNPVRDLPVELVDGNTVIWKTRTDNTGTAECWSGLFSQNPAPGIVQLSVIIDNSELRFAASEYDIGVNRITLPITVINPDILEIVFMVDATGSMGDELEYLKKEVLDVIGSVKGSNPSLNLRMGSVFYRDEGDEYVTRISPLDADISRTLDFINQQQADGGGDFPEAVHTAFDKTVNEIQWSDKAISRIVFLILDAPPHEDEQIYGIIRNDLEKAAEKGIRIIPVSASGIDKKTEFLLRFMAIASNGTYVFITDHSGIGNDHLEPTVGEYDVEFLNLLLIRLITEYSATN